MSKPPSLFFKKPTLNLFVFFCIKNAKLTISAVFYLRICKQPENVIIRMLLWVDDSLSVFIPSANSILLAFLLINLQRLRRPPIYCKIYRLEWTYVRNPLLGTCVDINRMISVNKPIIFQIYRSFIPQPSSHQVVRRKRKEGNLQIIKHY